MHEIKKSFITVTETETVLK